jgi:putative NADPH-quinone reductase
MCVLSVGGAEADYNVSGKYAMAIDAVLLLIHRGLFELIGFQVLPLFVAYGPNQVGDEQSPAIIEALRARIEALAGGRGINRSVLAAAARSSDVAHVGHSAHATKS